MAENSSISMVDSFEKTPCRVFRNINEGSSFAAMQIAELIRASQLEGRKFVLGCATGSSPRQLYAELVKLHVNEGLSFKNVVSFNLDEYYPIDNDAIQSYHSYMKRYFFDLIDIAPENIYIPDGEWSKEDIRKNCSAYEERIEAVGGIDLQILGIGRNGHIGFNEPGSGILSRTRLIALDNSTRLANAYAFPGISDVPRLAITMGINTIMKAKKIMLLAWGDIKAAIVREAVEGPVTERNPASLLQQHPDCLFVLDKPAAAELTRFKSPWLTGDIEWTAALVKKAVVNMALKAGKPILFLTDNDYNEHGLGDLLVEYGDAYQANLQVFYMLRDTITGWPGGKPGVHLPNHPERSEPWPKRVIIFSPHPDDDIISMGGSFQRLHDQGQEVHVAYQTSGNIAVTDEFVTRMLDFSVGFGEIAGIDITRSQQILDAAKKHLSRKKKNEPDTPDIRAIKGLIRRCEARATCRYVGIPEEQIHFLNLPFYETGTIEKNPPTDADLEITTALLKKLQPHQVFAAGDLADPHGTHKVCLDIILQSLRQIAAEGHEWINDCRLWLYKGAWQEWKIDEIEMAIPMSPDQVLQKRYGIFIHQSQKDMVPFQGADSREFWQRAEERNAQTAALYARLGLTQYAAMEAFVRCDFLRQD